jgi:hypothetical protein
VRTSESLNQIMIVILWNLPGSGSQSGDLVSSEVSAAAGAAAASDSVSLEVAHSHSHSQLKKQLVEFVLANTNDVI